MEVWPFDNWSDDPSKMLLPHISTVLQFPLYTRLWVIQKGKKDPISFQFSFDNAISGHDPN